MMAELVLLVVLLGVCCALVWAITDRGPSRTRMESEAAEHPMHASPRAGEKRPDYGSFMGVVQTQLDPGHDPRCHHYEWGPCNCVYWELRDKGYADEAIRQMSHKQMLDIIDPERERYE